MLNNTLPGLQKFISETTISQLTQTVLTRIQSTTKPTKTTNASGKNKKAASNAATYIRTTYNTIHDQHGLPITKYNLRSSYRWL
jgi:hypothetical protein